MLENQRGTFDLGICYNVIDHTDDPRSILDDYFSLIRDGGAFLFEVNLIDPANPPSEMHQEMHPSSFSEEKIRAWLDEYSDDYESHVSEEPTVDDNEFPFMAWGTKRGGA